MAEQPEAPLPPRLDPGAAELLALVRRTGPSTRAAMTERTGWARVTVTSRLETLLQAGLLEADDAVANGRGRPATRYRLRAAAAMHLVADVGALGMRLARVDLDGCVEDTCSLGMDVAGGPDPVLALVREGWHRLASAAPGRPVWGVGISLPGPVDFAAGRVVAPPIMTGWDGFPVRESLGGWFGCPVLVDNDVNAMAVGEAAVGRSTDDLLVVKVGTGVGCGIVTGGRVLRGSAGAAGDIGHTAADTGGSRSSAPECRCGNRGCVEAYAGGWAVARDLSALLGREVGVAEVVELLAAGHPAALRLVHEAGLVLGASLATAVSLLNPSAVVLSGQVAVAAGEHLLASVRQRIYSRALPLATRTLEVGVSRLWPDAGVHGLARQVGDLVLAAR